MHSRIFQLLPVPCDEKDYTIDPDSECLQYFAKKVDYIATVNNACLQQDLEWFGGYLKKYGITYNLTERTLTFPTDFKTRYANTKYEEFQLAVEEVTPDSFKTNYDYSIIRIEELFEDEFGFQIVEKDNDCCPLDKFLRHLEEGIPYTFYVNNVFDFHY